MKNNTNVYPMETVVSNLVSATQAITIQYFNRLKVVSAVLNKIHQPLTQNPYQDVWIRNESYYLEDLLILMFALIQLIKTFPNFLFAEATRSAFLSFHAVRLSQLLREGKPAHLSQTVAFQKLHAQ